MIGILRDGRHVMSPCITSQSAVIVQISLYFSAASTPKTLVMELTFEQLNLIAMKSELSKSDPSYSGVSTESQTE